MLRCAFMGSSSFSVPILEAIHKEGYCVASVFSKSDGGQRGRFSLSPVKRVADKMNIPCLEPRSLKCPDIQETLIALNLDLIIVVSYGLIIPEELLCIPRYGFLNVHPSLLPKYRGPAPIQMALSDGQKETGVSIMRIASQVDSGDVCLQKIEPIEDEDNFDSLENKLIFSSIKLLLESLKRLEIYGSLPFVEQYHEKATYTSKIDFSFSLIDWAWSSRKIFNRVKSLSYLKGGKTFWKGQLLKIFEISIFDDFQKSAPDCVGQVLSYQKKKGLQVLTGSGSIFIKSLQLEAGKLLTVRDFMNGKGSGIVGDLLSKKK